MLNFDALLATKVACSFIEYLVQMKGLDPSVLDLQEDDVDELASIFESQVGTFNQFVKDTLASVTDGFDDDPGTLFDEMGEDGYSEFEGDAECIQTPVRLPSRTLEQLFPCLSSTKINRR